MKVNEHGLTFEVVVYATDKLERVSNQKYRLGWVCFWRIACLYVGSLLGAQHSIDHRLCLVAEQSDDVESVVVEWTENPALANVDTVLVVELCSIPVHCRAASGSMPS